MFTIQHGTRPKRPVLPPRYMLKTFYVYDSGLRERDYLCGFPVKLDPQTGLLFVLMTAKQAEYWVTLGTLGPIPLSEVKGTRRAMLHQLSGGRIPVEEGGKPTHVMRNAVENPNVTAQKLAEGYHPVTGTTQTTEDQRRHSKSSKTQTSFFGGRSK